MVLFKEILDLIREYTNTGVLDPDDNFRCIRLAGSYFDLSTFSGKFDGVA